MLRRHSLPLVASVTLVVLLLASCDSTGTTQAPVPAETTVVTTTTTNAPTTIPAAASTTTNASTTTTTPESLFAASEVYEQVARDYCSHWPDIETMLTEDANYAEVSDDGLAVPTAPGFRKGVSADVVVGRDAVAATFAREDGLTAQCGTPASVSGDWVALPVSSSSADGSGTVGIWVLRIVGDQVQWHLAYGTPTADSPPPDSVPSPALVAEARQFCAIIEGTGYVRSADEFLIAMTDDPAVHCYPEGMYWTGTDEVRSMVAYYPASDRIWCSDEIITNGDWSAEPITIDNPAFNLKQVGMMVHNHIEGKIHRQFAHFTRTSGESWGLPLED